MLRYAKGVCKQSEWCGYDYELEWVRRRLWLKRLRLRLRLRLGSGLLYRIQHSSICRSILCSLPWPGKMAARWRLPAVDDDDWWLTRCSDRSTGSCSAAPWSRDTHLSCADHPPCGPLIDWLTSPELQRTTGCGTNDVMKLIPRGVARAADRPAGARCGYTSGVENSTFFACILSVRAYVLLQSTSGQL